MRKALNSRTLASVKDGDVLWDEKVRGLHYRQFKEGGAYYLYYRTKAGQQRKPKLAAEGVFNLEEARDRARKMLQEVREGGDPKGTWDTEATAGTVAELWTRHWDEHASKLKSKTDLKRLWTKYVGHRPIAKLKVGTVQYEHVRDLHKLITEKNGPIIANRVLALMSSMFTNAEKWRDNTGNLMRSLGSNPCQHVTRNPEVEREVYMTDEQMLNVIEALKASEKRTPYGVAWIKLMIYTGARGQDMRLAMRSYIKGDYIEYPKGSTKTDGTKKAKRHRVYLSPAAHEVIADLPNTGARLLPIERPKKLWERVRVVSGNPELRMHDLRHSFASVGLSNGLTLEQIGELLNHRNPRTTARYTHLIEGRGKDLVDAVAAAQQAALAKAAAARAAKATQAA